MKKRLLIVLCLCVTSLSIAQINEVGFFVGGTNYVGDIGRTNYILPSKPAIGLIYKWNWNPRIAVRGTYSYLPIEGKDSRSDNQIRVNRNISFSNTINELAVGIEFNFFEYDLSSDDKTHTPYILAEFVAYDYKTVKSEPTPGSYLYQNTTGYAIPFGIGYKSRFLGKLAIAVEARFRYTLKDDLDYTTSNISSLNFGGNGDDWYMFTGVSLVYTFGRPACYADPK
ncbi:outer membrane protein with beta-barrel domain [Lutibacter sp. Hel_I_33_5]|uniref:type IX secretion system protein PorG n=1 Tax=Lutibacter sp. Hel_I_33_5 TaxID=1566289 RepID=UPI0011A1968E|nr:DUF6089 family protein [Lutibacter sp. Hel_I_33_5]TVZ55941.1 outer membrane protein with beta-barrel domain [Lutibacter sp. Hel_I_33_5]